MYIPEHFLLDMLDSISIPQPIETFLAESAQKSRLLLDIVAGINCKHLQSLMDSEHPDTLVLYQVDLLNHRLGQVSRVGFTSLVSGPALVHAGRSRRVSSAISACLKARKRIALRLQRRRLWYVLTPPEQVV
jgi:hypothetical protein